MPLTADDCREILQALRGKATNFRYADVALGLHGGSFAPPKRQSNGSHRVWRHPTGRRVMIPDRGRGKLLPVYVKKAAKAILEAGGCDEHPDGG